MRIEAAGHESRSPAERRRESRIPAQLDLYLSAADEAHDALETNSVNLSLGGLCVRAARSYPVGTQLRLQLVLVDDALDLQGVVAWSNPRASELGVRFVDLSEEAGSRIEAVVWLLAAAAAS